MTLPALTVPEIAALPVPARPEYAVAVRRFNAWLDGRTVNVRAMPVEKVDANTLRGLINDTVEAGSRIITDEKSSYIRAAEGYTHESVNHSRKEWARGDVHTNTVEGFFSLLKRGLYGTFHAVSRKHLHRYVSEFQFRYNARYVNDGARTALVIQSAVGKRLHYRVG